MDIYTRKVISNRVFLTDITVLFHYSNHIETNEIVVVRTCIFLSLILGIEFETILNMKWSQIFKYNSNDKLILSKNIGVRNYEIPICFKLHEPIFAQVKKLDYPDLDQKIISIVNNTTKNIELEIYETIRKIFHFNSDSDVLPTTLDERNILKKLPLIMFGRRVFRVYGYSDKTCKFLKRHFKIKYNKDLLDFLGYDTIDEIDYELINIYIPDASKTFILSEKNFNHPEQYPFQDYEVFHDFLITRKGLDLTTASIRLLLLLGLSNGVRLSLLLQIKWKELVYITESGYARLISTLHIGKFILNISYPYIIKNHFLIDPLSNNLEYKELNSSVFVMNSGNPITQPSLHRNVLKALQNMSFRHYKLFTTKSPMIMYGRMIIEIKGDHGLTIKQLKEHFNFRSTKKLCEFLYIDIEKRRNKETYEFTNHNKSVFDEVLYDLAY